MNLDTLHEVEQFLYREARLLDRRQFHAWLELFTDDVHYWMPMRNNRYPKSSKALKILDHDRYADEELTGPNELALLDETKRTLSRRIARLDTGMAWAEDPPSRTRHLISNIEIEAGSTVDAAPSGGRVENRTSPNRARSDGVVGEKYQHLFLMRST